MFSTTKQEVDIFTKLLGRIKFVELKKQIGVFDKNEFQVVAPTNI